MSKKNKPVEPIVDRRLIGMKNSRRSMIINGIMFVVLIVIFGTIVVGIKTSNLPDNSLTIYYILAFVFFIIAVTHSFKAYNAMQRYYEWKNNGYLSVEAQK